MPQGVSLNYVMEMNQWCLIYRNAGDCKCDEDDALGVMHEFLRVEWISISIQGGGDQTIARIFPL